MTLGILVLATGCIAVPITELIVTRKDLVQGMCIKSV